MDCWVDLNIATLLGFSKLILQLSHCLWLIKKSREMDFSHASSIFSIAGSIHHLFRQKYFNLYSEFLRDVKPLWLPTWRVKQNFVCCLSLYFLTYFGSRCRPQQCMQCHSVCLQLLAKHRVWHLHVNTLLLTLPYKCPGQITPVSVSFNLTLIKSFDKVDLWQKI